MNYTKIHLNEWNVTVEQSSFSSPNGVEEYHLMLHYESAVATFEQQLQCIYAAEDHMMQLLGDKAEVSAHCIFKRYFLSDSTNQQPLMRQQPGIAISAIQQAPLDGSKVAVWMYVLVGKDDIAVGLENDTVVCRHNGYTHLWNMGLVESQGDSATQTTTVLCNYEKTLDSFGATLADNCIRTWFFVRDVDTQYAGLVKARRENFIAQGLTQHTHYISSTGIGGSPAETKALIQLGAYAMTGFEPSQQRYLYASTHLNPTYEYGVTFERGTVMEYGDRAHVFISGTASINNKGEVVHVGNIVKQTERMWENVETLLGEGDTSFDDVMQIIVYLRDTADYTVVSRLFQERFPNIPTVITLAPVCRPTWLIEMECIAVKQRSNAQYKNF